jgi:SpoVK/Ycf46/Vps4 family AAA+-type ATPase
MLARAVAATAHCTFFSCSSSSLVSKWRGESEKIVKCLFEAARMLAPTVVFVDELDALLSGRGGGDEHEASRRMKTEFMTEMDGFNAHTQLVIVLGATNCPWDIDAAVLRRFEKRIYVPLPDQQARETLFEIYIGKENIEEDINQNCEDGSDHYRSSESAVESKSGCAGGEAFSLRENAVESKAACPHDLTDDCGEIDGHHSVDDDPKNSHRLDFASPVTIAGVRWLAGRTEGFSGADINVICRDAKMMPVRRLMQVSEMYDEMTW